MESVLKLFQRTDCAAKSAFVNNQKLINEIKEVSRLLAYNECWFQYESDSDLIDACIFQRAELNSRYRYLLNAAKRNGVNCSLL